jgi:hypothetical protein
MRNRPDGRIEPGQKLASAISARAWTRAQDAADIVLGERTGFGAEGPQGQPDQLRHTVFFLPDFLQGNFGITHRFGMIVQISDGSLPANPGDLRGSRPPLTPGIASAVLANPVTFVNRRQTASLPFAVLCNGRAAANSYATVCSHGTILAMVRKNPGGLLPRVRLPVIRYASDTSLNLRGIAEDSDCGPGELLRWTNIRPFSTEQQEAEGIDSPRSLDDTLNNVYYAVVRL